MTNKQKTGLVAGVGTIALAAVVATAYSGVKVTSQILKQSADQHGCYPSSGCIPLIGM